MSSGICLKMFDIIEYIRDKYQSWGWIGQRAHDAAGINSILPLDFIISCDHGADLPLYFREDDVFSVEKYGLKRENWSNEDLKTSLEGDLGKKIYEYLGGYSSPVNLLCYRSLKQLEPGSKNFPANIKMYASRESLKKHFDNKNLFYNVLPKMDLPRPRGRVTRLRNNEFDDIGKKFGIPFVAQFPYSSSGYFTFIIKERKEYAVVKEKYPDDSIVIREYIEGFSLNINAVIVSADPDPRVLCSFPSVQITGIPECSSFASAFCGNDYSAAKKLNDGIIKQVKECTEKVGLWMAAAGYRGIFGMDFIVGDGIVYPAEINPRFQNSTSLHTILCACSGYSEKALFLFQIAEFLQSKDKHMRKYLDDFSDDDLMQTLDGAQLILHNRPEQAVVTENLIPGVYRGGETLKFVESEAVFKEHHTENDLLVTCGIPGRGTIVAGNAPICKLQTRKSILDVDNLTSLTTEGKELTSLIYDKLGLKAKQGIKRGIKV